MFGQDSVWAGFVSGQDSCLGGFVSRQDLCLGRLISKCVTVIDKQDSKAEMRIRFLISG
jgi:hypothetical protein